MHSFLVPLLSEDDQKALGQKQYLVGEVGENCNSMNIFTRIERVSAIRLPYMHMDDVIHEEKGVYDISRGFYFTFLFKMLL